jgi:hypothetical protein
MGISFLKNNLSDELEIAYEYHKKNSPNFDFQNDLC